VKIIIPCCDRISYKKDHPRFISPDNRGFPLIKRVIDNFNCDDIVISLYKDQDIKFNIIDGMQKLFGDIQFCLFENESKSQAETIVDTINKLNINESIFIKDCDSSFEFDIVEDCNYICVDYLDGKKVNINDKSYIQIDHNNSILNIREKMIISNIFSVGGYFFESSKDFITHYNYLTNNLPEWQNKIYISDIIGSMILSGIDFEIKNVKNYKDYGTKEDWANIIENEKIYFVEVDGFLFEQGSSYFYPRFENTIPINGNVDYIKKNVLGKYEIVYISNRPKELEDLTRDQLMSIGLIAEKIIFEMNLNQVEK
jgi:hypothetical protein